MILSASRRTDLPCFYSEWFINRLRAGFVMVKNPMNPAQVRRIILSPETVDCIVFWTKDPAPLLPRLKEIDQLGYRYYFQFTLTPYDRRLEAGLREKTEILQTFKNLSDHIGSDRVIWRYDPILLNDFITVDNHKKQFEFLCSQLHRHTKTVTISFVDRYPKLKTDLIRELTEDEIGQLSLMIRQTAKSFGLVPKACCEAADLSFFGIEKASCIDKNLAEQLCGHPLQLKQDKNQRKGCGCCESIDVGAYNTCINGCIYCYANRSLSTAMRNFSAHRPENEFLTD